MEEKTKDIEHRVRKLEARLALIELTLIQDHDRTEAINTAVLHPDRGHSVHDRLRGDGHS